MPSIQYLLPSRRIYSTRISTAELSICVSLYNVVGALSLVAAPPVCAPNCLYQPGPRLKYMYPQSRPVLLSPPYLVLSPLNSRIISRPIAPPR